MKLPRLIGDHVISRPKAQNEYRIVVLGSSEVWGYLNRPQDTMPVVLDAMQLQTPDGRTVRSYNLAYVYPDAFKDMLILDTVLENTDRPDLIIFTANSTTFRPIDRIHWLTENNPELALKLAQQYNLLNLPLDPVKDAINKTSWFERDNFWAQRQDVAMWLTNQMYGFTWASSGLDYPQVRGNGRKTAFSGELEWENMRPGVLNAIVNLAHAYNVPLLLVSVPADYSSKYDGWIQEQANQLHIPLLECSKLLPPQAFTNTLLHISADGHRQVANNMALWLQMWFRDPTLDGKLVKTCNPQF